jgi:hypothetical protein
VVLFLMKKMSVSVLINFLLQNTNLMSVLTWILLEDGRSKNYCFISTLITVLLFQVFVFWILKAFKDKGYINSIFHLMKISKYILNRFLLLEMNLLTYATKLCMILTRWNKEQKSYKFTFIGKWCSWQKRHQFCKCAH